MRGRSSAGRATTDSTRPSRSSWLSTSSTSCGGRVRASAIFGRLGFDIPLPEVGGRGVFRIADDNDLSTGLDCRCQHVPVGWIREFESLDKVRVSYPETRRSLTARYLAALPSLTRVASRAPSKLRPPTFSGPSRTQRGQDRGRPAERACNIWQSRTTLAASCASCLQGYESDRTLGVGSGT
jgi:hypothetical protein